VYAAALIAASTSPRAADLRGLRWSDIDLFERVMTIPDSKSEAGKRRLPLNPDAVLAFGILLERATKLGIAGSEFYVFPACENSRNWASATVAKANTAANASKRICMSRTSPGQTC